MYEVKQGDYVLIGLVLNDQEAEKLVTFGPSTDNTEEAKAFRNFWGSKADLRRFQDGSITETVVWTETPHKLIVSSISQYLIDRHLGQEIASTLKFEQDKFMRLLPVGENPASVSSRTAFQAKHVAFQKLASHIQDIEELPLRVHAIHAASASLRDSSLAMPVPFDVSGDDSIGQGIIEFESSGKWPDDLDAVESLKVAFLLNIAKHLNEKSAYRARTGVEEDYMPAGGPRQIGFLQVLTEDGFAFQLRVATDYDALLYRRLDKENHLNLSGVYKQRYLSCISHSRTIQTLSQRFPFYSASVRLVKHWFNAHLLTSQISEEAIELIALKPFLDSAPYLPPSSPMSAFCRTLEFLATWNWRDEALVLDVEKVSDRARDAESAQHQKLSIVEGTQMEARTYRQLMDAFSKQRVADPVLTHAPMFIATKNDASGVTWTQNERASAKGKVVASRMTALARAAFHVLTTPGLGSKEKIAHIFRPALADYDILIHAQDPQFGEISSSGKRGQSTFKNLALSQGMFPGDEEFAVRTANVVDKFFEELSDKYNDSIIFFRGTLDSKTEVSAIGGVWHHDVVEPKPFKVNLRYNTIPVPVTGGSNGGNKNKKQATGGGTSLVVLNKAGILEEIEMLGSELIQEIELCK